MIDWLFFPFASAFMFAGFLIGIVLITFWIWMIIDCAKRNFKKDWEKIFWILVMIFVTWVGALAYFFVIKSFNPKGILIK